MEESILINSKPWVCIIILPKRLTLPYVYRILTDMKTWP